MGFVLGDGTINTDAGELRFSNTDKECMKKMIANFEAVFGISKEDFSYYLVVPRMAQKDQASKEWRLFLGIGKEITARDDKGGKARRGILSAVLRNRTIVEDVWREADSLSAQKDEGFVVGFLRGFFAAEGAIIPGKKRKEVPNAIQFPQKGKQMPQLVSRMLGRLGIESRVVIKQKKAEYYCANITAYENFKRFYSLGLAGFHPAKSKKLKIGLDAYKNRIGRRRSVGKNLLRLLSLKKMTRKDIYQSMGKGEQHINGILYNPKRSFLLRNKFIKKTLEKKEIFWEITQKGRAYLENVGP